MEGERTTRRNVSDDRVATTPVKITTTPVKIATTSVKIATAPVEMTIDEALERNGSCGKFQITLQILFTYLTISIGYQSVMSYFIADDPPWKCADNSTDGFCEKHQGIEIQKDSDDFHYRCSMNRTDWIYTTDNQYSFVTEFDMICEKTSLAALTSGLYHLGGASGVFVTGIVADKLGRKYSLIGCVVLAACISIVCCFVTNIIELAVLRVFLGATGWSAYNIIYVYMGEIVPPNYRAMSANTIGLGFSISVLLIDLVAYYCRAWRKLQLFASFPCLAAVLLLITIPDSPRWYLVSGKKEMAEKTLKKIGELNNHPQSFITLKTTFLGNDGEKRTYFDLIRHRKIFMLTSALGFIWYTAAMTFYMISFESSNLGGDMYASFAYSQLATLPGNFVMMYLLNRFGRKPTILSFLVISGTLAGSTTIIPTMYAGKYTVKMILLVLANFFAYSAITGCFVWTFELYPTSLRLQGWGVCIAMERLGSFTAPFLTTLLHEYKPRLPYIFVMVFTFVSAAGGFILPETNKVGTREHFDDFFDGPRAGGQKGNGNQSFDGFSGEVQC